MVRVELERCPNRPNEKPCALFKQPLILLALATERKLVSVRPLVSPTTAPEREVHHEARRRAARANRVDPPDR
jgi:hypothetical protein